MVKKQSSHHDTLKSRILSVSAKYFLEKGYSATTMKDIAKASSLSMGSLTNIFASKEDILCGLVSIAIDAQFYTTENLTRGLTDDELTIYATETVLQLHITEINENLRDTYTQAYSLPKASEIIKEKITGKLESIFRKEMPHYKTADFYKLEISAAGIMRSFITVPSDMWFTMEDKISSFLESTFLICRVDDERINKIISFIKQFDFKKAAIETVESMIAHSSDGFN